MAETERDTAAVDAVREATRGMNDALRQAHEAGLQITIDVIPFQTVADRYPGYLITGHCRKISYEINQPF